MTGKSNQIIVEKNGQEMIELDDDDSSVEISEIDIAAALADEHRTSSPKKPSPIKNSSSLLQSRSNKHEITA